MKKIKAQLKVSGMLMLGTWILLVLVPTLSARLGLELYFSSFFVQNRIRNEPQLFTEIQHFSEDLDEKSYLRHKLEVFDQQNHFVDFSELPDSSTMENLRSHDADNLRKKLQEQLKIPVLAVFASNIDSQNVSFSRNQKIRSEIGAPSRTLLRRMFWLINDQESASPLLSKTFRRAFPSGTDFSDQLMRKNYSVNFLQIIFGTIYPPIIEPKSLHETVAGKIGPTGNVLFYYSRSRLVGQKKTNNLGAYLAVIRLQDFPEKLLVSFAAGRKTFPAFKRKIGHISRAIRQPDKFNAINLSGFHQYKDRYALMTLLPQVPMVRRIQQGSIYPRDFSSFNGRTAVIEVSIANELLHHPLKVYEKQMHFAILLISMAATAIMLHLWLFGFTLNASVTMKVALATVFCAFLPLISLVSLSVVYQDYQTQVETESTRRFIETRAALIQRKLSETLQGYSKNTDNLVKLIQRHKNYDESFLQKLFADWCRENCASGVLFQKFDQKAMNYIDPNSALDHEFSAAWSFKKVFFKSVVELIFSSPIFSTDTDSYSTVLTAGTNNSEATHSSLANDGELLNISRFSYDSRMSGMLIKTGKAGKTIPFGYVGVDYSVSRIFSRAFKTLFKDFALEDEFGNFQIDVALCELKNGRTQFIETCSSSRLNKNLIVNQVAQMQKIQKNLLRTYEDKVKQYHSILLISPNLPYAAVVQASQPLKRKSTFFHAGLLIYPLLILASALLLSQIFFVQPSRQLYLGLREIAEGNLQKKIEIPSQDEFMQLGEDLNKMTKSLLEKEQLEKFVSPDVIKEINRNTEAEMLPGGEKIQATVLFSTFKISEINKSEDAGTMVEHLDLFLGICNSICANNHGVIDKIIGNTIMMVFRGNFDRHSHALRAADAGIQIHQAMLSNGVFNCRCCSGISSGTVISGKIGSKTGKLDFTVIGDTANTAARLKALAEKLPGSKVIISQSTAFMVKNKFNLQELEPVELKGKQGLHKTWAIS